MQRTVGDAGPYMGFRHPPQKTAPTFYRRALFFVFSFFPFLKVFEGVWGDFLQKSPHVILSYSSVMLCSAMTFWATEAGTSS